MLKTNYHTHSIFCDGKESPEEICLSAIEKNFDYFGFSSHSMYPFASTWHIAPNNFQNYVDTVRNLQKKYSDRIKILLGFEGDYVPGICKPDFSTYKRLSPDYLIGSVHYIITEKGRLAVDYSAKDLKAKIDELFKGNARKVCQEYFYLEREMLSNCSFTIIGHPDLVRKNNGELNMFDEKDSWYRKEIKATADAIKKAGVVAEVNTGAIARKKMDDVYPSSEMLELLCQRGVPVTISSDAHTKDGIDCAFDRALLAIKKAGYKELAYINESKEIAFQKIV